MRSIWGSEEVFKGVVRKHLEVVRKHFTFRDSEETVRGSEETGVVLQGKRFSYSATVPLK